MAAGAAAAAAAAASTVAGPVVGPAVLIVGGVVAVGALIACFWPHEGTTPGQTGTGGADTSVPLVGASKSKRTVAIEIPGSGTVNIDREVTQTGIELSGGGCRVTLPAIVVEKRDAAEHVRQLIYAFASLVIATQIVTAHPDLNLDPSQIQSQIIEQLLSPKPPQPPVEPV